jgi:copper resistance protein D
VILFLYYGVRLLHYTATMAVFGGSLLRLMTGQRAIDRPLRTIIFAAAVLSLSSAAAWLLLEAGIMADDPAVCLDPATIRLVLTETLFGHLWRLRLAIGLVLLAVSGRWWPIMILAGLSLLFLAGEGHGSLGTGETGRLHLAAQAIHLLAAGAWLGGLLPLALILRDHRIAEADARVAIARFSTLGYLAVSLVVLTGVLNTEVLAGSVPAFSSPWAVSLGVKLMLVAAMVALALINRAILLPRWQGDPEGARIALFMTVIGEACLAILVLLAASVLGTLQPPGS